MDSTTTDGSATAAEADSATVERRLRLRVLLDEYRTILAIALVLALALGAWASYGAYASPDETTEQRLVDSWTATGEFDHGATVAEPTPVHDEGDVLTGEPLYYTAVTPTLDGEFVGGYDAETGENVRVSLTVDVVYRAVDPDGETVYWSQREQLATADESGVVPGEEVSVAFAVDVTEIAAAIDEIEGDLGASPGEAEIAIEVEREIDGTIDGEDRAVADRFRIPIEFHGDAYEVAAAERYDESHERYETETVTASPGPLRSVGGPLLLVVGLAGLVGLALVDRRWPTPTDAEREWLAYRADRDQFAEVITPVRLPDSRLDGPRAEVDDLETLAEFAIDVGAPLVSDPRRELYAVCHDGLVYAFEPPTLGREDGDPDDADRDETNDPDEESDGDETGGRFTYADSPTPANSSAEAADDLVAPADGDAGDGRESVDDSGARSDPERSASGAGDRDG